MKPEEKALYRDEIAVHSRFLKRLLEYAAHTEGCPGGERCTCGLRALFTEMDDEALLPDGLESWL